MHNAEKILTSHEKFHISLGLDRIRAIMEILGNPQNTFKSIHIAGTNGKGSTASIINQILIDNFKNKKINIGLFTSPHIFSYEERIVVNNEKISSYLFDKLIYKIDILAKKNNIDLSEFELITACAFYYFYIKKAEFVVLETGLGGLYDATNIVQNSPLQVITQIDLDHTERLGKTTDEIAIQKAGIIKQNSKVVISPNNKGFNEINKIAAQKNAKIIFPADARVKFEDKNYAYINDKKFEFSLLGQHQSKNLSLALAAVYNLGIEISEDTLFRALKNVRWIARLQYVKNYNILIDGAHNPSGIKTLRNFLDNEFKDKQKKIFFGCLKNKDYKCMLEILLNQDDEFYFIEYKHQNSLKFDDLDEKYKKICKKAVLNNDLFIKEDKLKVFCGSLYMIGEIFKDKKII